jgi:hypothetical protein
MQTAKQHPTDDLGDSGWQVSMSVRIQRRLRDLLRQAHAGSAGYDRLRRWIPDSGEDEAARSEKDKERQKVSADDEIVLQTKLDIQLFEQLRAKSFKTLGSKFPRLVGAGITQLSPLHLRSRVYVIVAIPGSTGRVAFGEGAKVSSCRLLH